MVFDWFRKKERNKLESNQLEASRHAISLKKDGDAKLNLAMNGVNQVKNLENAIKCYKKAKAEGLILGTNSFASADANEGIALSMLGELGIDPISNFENAIQLLEKSREEGFERNTQNNAITFMEEGIARLRLGELGVNPSYNLDMAIKLCQRARIEGLIPNSLHFAKAFINEGAARIYSAINGNDPENNLIIAIDLFEKARNNGYKINTPGYAVTYENESLARIFLAQFGIDPKNNLNIAIALCEKARKGGAVKRTSYYAGTLLNEGLSRILLAEFGINTIENLNIAIKLLERARNEGLIKGSPAFEQSLKYECQALLSFALNGIDPVNNLEKCINYCERIKNKGFLTKNTSNYAKILFMEGIAKLIYGEYNINPVDNFFSATTILEQSRMEGLVKGTSDYGTALAYEGIARTRLAELGINMIINLKKSVDLYQKARNEGLIKKTKPYAISLMNESSSRQLLAEVNVDSIDNLTTAIEVNNRARNEGLEPYSSEYASTFLNEGTARHRFAELGIDPLQNLNEAIELFQRARIEGFEPNSDEYAIALMDEGVSRQWFAEFGFNPIDNLKNAIILNERARNEGFVKDTPGYAKAMINENVARQWLAELGIDPVNNLNKAIDLCEGARNEGFIRDTPDYAKCSINEGNARRLLAELGINAKDNLIKAIESSEIARKTGAVDGTPDYARSLTNEGSARNILAELGIDSIKNSIIAIELFELARKHGFAIHTPDYARSLMNEGNSRLKLAKMEVDSSSNLVVAESLYLAAKDIFTRTNDRRNLVSVNKNIGLLKYSNDEMNIAYDYLKEAIQIIEELRASINIPEIRREYFETVTITYKYMAFTCLALGRKKEFDAFCYVESSKGRTFLELLANEKKKLHGNSNLIEEYRSVLKRINDIDAIVAREKRKEVLGNLNTESQRLKALYKKLLLEIKESDPEYYSIQTVEPIKIDNLIKILNGRVLVEFFLGEKLAIFIIKDNLMVKILEKMFLFYWDEISKEANAALIEFLLMNFDLDWVKNAEFEKVNDKTLKISSVHNFLTIELNDDKTKAILKIDSGITYELIVVIEGGRHIIYDKINEITISKKVQRFRECISNIEKYLWGGINPDKIKAEEKAELFLRYFYNLLILPILEHLDKEKENVIVPHSYLHLIPFQALKHETYIVEEFELCFAQSASSLQFLKKSSGTAALVIGDPMKDLKYAKEEAIEISKLFDTTAILGDNAKKERVMQEVRGKEILHFSCHGIFDSINPAFSRIILSDGSITAIDFMDLEMNANLAVISACETAVAKVTSGDEVESLVRAIQYGGCRFVIASLWKVDDQSTKELLLDFYKEEGDVVEKIRKAELIMMNSYSFFHWAPFQLYGI